MGLTFSFGCIQSRTSYIRNVDQLDPNRLNPNAKAELGEGKAPPFPKNFWKGPPFIMKN